MALVTCVGMAVRDLVFRTEAPVAVGEKNLASSLTATTGGPAANAAVAVAAMGGSARLVAKLGADATGDAVLVELEARDVDTSRVRRIAGISSSVSGVIVDGDGNRTIINRTADAIVDNVDTPTLDDLERSDAVLVDMRWPDGARAAIRLASTLAIPVVVDFDLTTLGSHCDIIEAATHVLFSRPALIQMAGTDDIDHALAVVSHHTRAFVGVTLGGEGFRWIDQGRVRSHSAFDVDVVDTLGAGDVFHGAFALGLAEGRSTDAIVSWSSGAAALMCASPSGTGRFPSREDVLDLLEAPQR